MNQIGQDIQKIAKALNIPIRKEITIIIPTQYRKCNNCTGSTPHEAVFSCGHETCTNCVDKLADAYEFSYGDDLNTILKCPYCKSCVVNVEYK